MKSNKSMTTCFFLLCVGLLSVGGASAALTNPSEGYATQEECLLSELNIPDHLELNLRKTPELGSQYFTLACNEAHDNILFGATQRVIVFNNDGQGVEFVQGQSEAEFSGLEFDSSGRIILANNQDEAPVLATPYGAKLRQISLALPFLRSAEEGGCYQGNHGTPIIGCGGKRIVVVQDFDVAKSSSGLARLAAGSDTVCVVSMFDENGKPLGYFTPTDGKLYRDSGKFTPDGKYFVMAEIHTDSCILHVLNSDGKSLPICIYDKRSHNGCRGLTSDGYTTIVDDGSGKPQYCVATVGDSLIVRKSHEWDVMFVPEVGDSNSWIEQKFYVGGEPLEHTSISILGFGKFLGVTPGESGDMHLFTQDGQHISLEVDGKTVMFDNCYVGLGGRFVAVREHCGSSCEAVGNCSYKHFLFELDGLQAIHRPLLIDGQEIVCGGIELHEDSGYIAACSPVDTNNEQCVCHMFDSECQYVGTLSDDEGPYVGVRFGFGPKGKVIIASRNRFVHHAFKPAQDGSFIRVMGDEMGRLILFETPDGNYILAECDTGEILVNVEDQSKLLLPKWKTYGGPPCHFGFGPNGKYCAVSTKDFGWQLFDVEQRKAFRFVRAAGEEPIVCKTMALASDGSYVVITDTDNRCYVVNFAPKTWSVRKHSLFRNDKRAAIRTLWTLAQARKCDVDDHSEGQKEVQMAYPQTGLAELPAELLALVSNYITAPGRGDEGSAE